MYNWIVYILASLKQEDLELKMNPLELNVQLVYCIFYVRPFPVMNYITKKGSRFDLIKCRRMLKEAERKLALYF